MGDKRKIHFLLLLYKTNPFKLVEKLNKSAVFSPFFSFSIYQSIFPFINHSGEYSDITVTCRLHVTTSNHGNPPSIPVLFVRIMKKKRSNYHKKVGLCYDLTKMTTNTKKAREKLNVLTTWETILGIMYRNMLHSRYHLLS